MKSVELSFFYLGTMRIIKDNCVLLLTHQEKTFPLSPHAVKDYRYFAGLFAEYFLQYDRAFFIEKFLGFLYGLV